MINERQKLTVKTLLANMLFAVLDRVITNILIFQSSKMKINTKEKLSIRKIGKIQQSKIKMSPLLEVAALR